MKPPISSPVLFYQGPRQLRLLCAFCFALIIFATAVAIGGMHSNTQIERIAGAPDASEILATDPSVPMDQVAPPLMDELPVPIQPDAPEFIDEQRPWSQPKKIDVIPRIKRMPNGGATMAFGKAMTVFAPRPEYPYQARCQKITGSGVAFIAIDSVSGTVLSVSTAQSAGSPILDNAAIQGLKRWRFKPGTASKIRCPITFTLSGAAY
jgi:TonB family protein